MRTEQDKLITSSRVPANDYPMSGKFMLRRFCERWKSSLQATSAYEKLPPHSIYVQEDCYFSLDIISRWHRQRVSRGEAAKTRNEKQWKLSCSQVNGIYEMLMSKCGSMRRYAVIVTDLSKQSAVS